MFFLNLSPVEFLALFSAVSGMVVTLYLLDRSRRRQVVSTLRFWQSTQAPESVDRRRKINQPWSLLLQIISLALLLLAIAQPRFSSPEARQRDHVLLLDTSSSMAAKSGNATLSDQAVLAAKAYVEGLPHSDRVMVVRADALMTPATAFESDHQKLWDAIEKSRPSNTALQLDQALNFAQQTQKQHGQTPGEIVYVGAGRLAGDAPNVLPTNLRVLPLRSSSSNVGLRRVGARRRTDADAWQIFVVAHNYGSAAVMAPLGLRFGSAPIAERMLTIPAGQDEEASFDFRTKAAGVLDVSLLNPDAIPADNSASLELPAVSDLSVAVYSANQELWKPLFAANPHLKAGFFTPAQYTAAGNGAQVVICDRFEPKTLPTSAGLVLVEPPREQSAIPVRRVASETPLTLWRNDVRLGAGLRTKNVKLASTEVFQPAANDIVVAETKDGPVIVARETPQRMVAIGFEPADSAMKYELATPLLFANILGWMAPNSFRDWELQAGSVGTTTVELETADAKDVKLVTDQGQELPYTQEGKTLRFFTTTPGIVRLQQGARETVYSLSLPEVAESTWTLPANVRQGLPRSRGSIGAPTEWWPWFAVLGLLGLVVEWVIFGRARLRANSNVVPLSMRDRFGLRRAS